MGDKITIQDIVAKAVMENGGTAQKKEIVRKTGLKPSQVQRAKHRLVQRGLFTSESIKKKKRQPYEGFIMTAVRDERTDKRMDKLLKKFEV